MGRKSRARPNRPCRYAKLGCTEPCAKSSSACREHARQDAKRRAARKRTKLIEMLSDRQLGTCLWCFLPLRPEELSGTHIDHVIPVSLGGPDEPWNWQLLHGPCNQAKSDKITVEGIALAAEHGINLRAA